MTPSAPSFVTVETLSKNFGSERVLDRVGFTLERESVFAILGRSGGGKTTLLKILAGLVAADSGRFRLDGRDLTALPPEKRQVVYLYQEPLLFPHLSVRENLVFGLRLRRLDEAAMRARIDPLVERLGLGDHLEKMPAQLSGGQRQRVAFGRALAIQPPLLLLDEPFGSLDATTRAEMQKLFREVARQVAITAIFVTHDVKEALIVGDRFGHLAGGQLRQFADAAGFVADPVSGAAAEIAFWNSLAAKTPSPPRV
ncbi:MAG: ABC transporter ATP-binding protein [Opitutaceae bacterium]